MRYAPSPRPQPHLARHAAALEHWFGGFLSGLLAFLAFIDPRRVIRKPAFSVMARPSEEALTPAQQLRLGERYMKARIVCLGAERLKGPTRRTLGERHPSNVAPGYKRNARHGSGLAHLTRHLLPKLRRYTLEERARRLAYVHEHIDRFVALFLKRAARLIAPTRLVATHPAPLVLAAEAPAPALVFVDSS